MSTFDFAKKELELSTGKKVGYYSLQALEEKGYGNLSKTPKSVKILIESLVRMQGHPAYTPEQVTALAKWSPTAEKEELPYMPARVLLQDFTGVPCVVDLAALRSAMQKAGKDAGRIEPLIPVDLVIDHSVQLDDAGHAKSFSINVGREFERNEERYKFLKWGQQAFEKLRVLPPGLGICHQINMEYLAGCVMLGDDGVAYPDTLVGTDSHTTTINCMGVLGWGVGGIEAEAAMLGQPIPILTPEVVGFKLTGKLRAGVTATDLALTVTKMLRTKGVVNKFVEFYGEGAANLSLADRCPVANMGPEYGATMGFFAIDEKTIDYLRETGRSDEQCELVEKYCKAQGLWGFDGEANYTDTLELDLGSVVACVAGPNKPQQRLAIGELKQEFNDDFKPSDLAVDVPGYGVLKNGAVVIASITSCTNTSNPSLVMGAGLIAKKAVEKGLTVPGYVKTSLAPGSQVATEYLKESGLLQPLETLGFNVAAYGCATCIGNSGPLAEPIEAAIKENKLTVGAVLSGNRNFEGRVHPLTRSNYLASPPLVVAYALAGTVDINLEKDPIGKDKDGNDVFLKDIWYTEQELSEAIKIAANSEYYKSVYADVFTTNAQWNALEIATGSTFDWDDASTYIREPTFFEGCEKPAGVLADIENAAVLGYFGDFITTDHISPAGVIPAENPTTEYLLERGVEKRDFNSFGSRRGNHEVMMRGTFGNIRIKNKLVEREGGFTAKDGKVLPIYTAAMEYIEEGKNLVILAGQMYGAGSSRDWAAKGTKLQGDKAVIAESFERIHRSNLVGMGVVPCEFINGETAESLGLTGKETYSITGIATGFKPGKILTVKADGKTFQVKARVDTPLEIEYLRNGGVLNYVLRNFMAEA
ncbi:MAG: aconitate hydratase AcnA [Kiritimatiellales bacterium]|nr:aconitate hydratase AcnA [Kiritimatiellales bacterium]